MVSDDVVRRFLGLSPTKQITQEHRDRVEKMLANTRRHELRYRKSRERGKRHRH
jgi:hypothetical protein